MKSVSKSEEIYFLSGKRTPLGTYGGSLKERTSADAIDAGGLGLRVEAL